MLIKVKLVIRFKYYRNYTAKYSCQWQNRKYHIILFLFDSYYFCINYYIAIFIILLQKCVYFFYSTKQNLPALHLCIQNCNKLQH